MLSSPAVLGGLCGLLGAAIYLNTLDCGLCYDDLPAIIENQDLRPNQSWYNLLSNDFWGVPMVSEGSHKSYRPLCVATFRLNYLLAELEPMGYHLVNILLHGVVCYLYVHLVSLVCSEVWPALIAGLLFAVHPIHTEAVSVNLFHACGHLDYVYTVGSFSGGSCWLSVWSVFPTNITQLPQGH